MELDKNIGVMVGPSYISLTKDASFTKALQEEKKCYNDDKFSSSGHREKLTTLNTELQIPL